MVPCRDPYASPEPDACHGDTARMTRPCPYVIKTDGMAAEQVLTQRILEMGAET